VARVDFCNQPHRPLAAIQTMQFRILRISFAPSGKTVALCHHGRFETGKRHQLVAVRDARSLGRRDPHFMLNRMLRDCRRLAI